MSSKRPRDDRDDAPTRKKQRGGFQVGPANLPDGTYRRKVQKIKKNLVGKAKLKKQYAKIRERELANHPARRYDDNDNENGEDEATHTNDKEPSEQPEPASLELHPDRQDRLKHAPPADDSNDREDQDDEDGRTWPGDRRKWSKPKTKPFAREAAEAQKRKDEAEVRRKAREEAEAERERKAVERENFRKAMAKARSGGRNGQRRLGREGPVLLEKVKKLVG